LSFTSSSSNAGKVSASKKSFSSVKYLNCFSHVFYACMLINCVFFFFQCACTWLMFDAFLASLSCLSSLHSWHLGYGCLQPLWFYSLRSLDVVRCRWSNELHYDSFWLAVLDMHHSPCLNNAELFLEISWCC